MAVTTNLNNKYTVTVVTDPTGGDNNPTSSGYNFSYDMVIVPNQGEQIIGGDFKIDNIASVIADGSVGYPQSTPVVSPHNQLTSYSHVDLRTSTLTDVCFNTYVFEPNPSFQSKNIDYIILTEEYNVADYPIAFNLKIFMLPSFLNAGPSNLQVDLDIDLVTLVISGCTDPDADNYNPVANLDDGSCTYPIVGCMDDGTNPAFPGRPSNAIPGPANNYNQLATSQGVCNYTTLGCTEPTASNYDPNATIDDGSCTFPVYGCTNPLATNFNPLATVDDNSCIVPVLGCTNQNSLNYNPSATADDGSCITLCEHVTLVVEQRADLDVIDFQLTIDSSTNTNIHNYSNNTNFSSALAVSVNGHNPYHVNYISAPDYHMSQSPPQYFSQGYNVAPNYYNTLQIDYDDGAGFQVRCKDLNLTEDYFGLEPDINSPSTNYFQNTSKVFTIDQLSYDGGLTYENVRTGVYQFIFVIDDGFGNKCFRGVDDPDNPLDPDPGNLILEFTTNVVQNGGPGPQPPTPPPTPEGEGGEVEAESPVGLPPAPEGFHYMPDGSLMSDAEHQATFGSQAVIRTSTNLGTSSGESGTSSTSGY
tara:strand:+ start:607 stop:2367 length:1761 start_codon:yes stop_codon:yes gene_type:complete